MCVLCVAECGGVVAIADEVAVHVAAEGGAARAHGVGVGCRGVEAVGDGGSRAVARVVVAQEAATVGGAVGGDYLAVEHAALDGEVAT